MAVTVRILAGVMLLLAIGNWPYSYYQLLRIAVCGASIFLIWYFQKINMKPLSMIFLFPAILFNPIAPFYLDKQFWHTLDMIFGLLFLASLSADYKKSDS